MGPTKRTRQSIIDIAEYFRKHQKTLSQSFNYAVEGLTHALKTQRNMKIHFAAAFAVLVIALFLRVSRLEIIALLFAIAFVIAAELFNTAIEVTVDLAVGDNEQELARIAKDVAAAGVLVAAATSVFVGFLVFFKRANPATLRLVTAISQSPEYLSGIAVMLVFGASLVLKVIIGEGTPARGGWPSMHSAVAGSLFTSITIISRNFLIGTLAFLLALLVMQSRVEKEIHTFFEVVSGALLGIFGTVLLFQLFYF